MLSERWGRPSMLRSICQHVARLQFDCCAEKHSLCGTVMIHDGVNLTCLDQCHGVRSHGTRESLPTEACLCRHQCFSVVGQATAEIRPRPAQGLFSNKELHRTAQAIAQMNADWKVGKAQYAEFNVPTCGEIAVWQVCKETQPVWNIHDS